MNTAVRGRHVHRDIFSDEVVSVLWFVRHGTVVLDQDGSNKVPLLGGDSVEGRWGHSGLPDGPRRDLTDTDLRVIRLNFRMFMFESKLSAKCQ